MADAYVDMSGEDESESQSRHARRRRIEVRRSATFPGEASTSAESLLRAGNREDTSNSEVSGDEKRRSTDSTNLPSLAPARFSFADSLSVSTSSSGDAVDSTVIASSSGRKVAVNTPIAFGSVSLTGRAREMEDAISVRPGFVQFPDGCSPLHFFGVFDGHGGSHVSALCKERMHSLLAEELMRVPAPDEPVVAEETRWRSAVERCFVRMDQLALSACACGRVGEPLCRCDRSGIESEIVGSTAVVAVVGGGRLLVANCGDSRAVLSRGGRTVPLSIDQKPDRPDELARIEAAGGRVIYVNGARVHGILAMSRALGDKYLKPVVISAPEIVILEITPEDECLIIASDGLWDVIPNELACNVARRCLAEGSPKLAEKDLNNPTSAGEEAPISNEKDQAAPEAWCSMAAALLARLALGRRSTDNISVIVVDLRRG
ncbi:probable protein phosphatase 2C 68 [Dendrobium catenatum]|uniref:protein-serine/threonine phosphatase n=1 Tax=Dendrobium catenatum TaxID=906689 RepID=A0A2I0WH45_9ASPA|nr:probable protein phosphatase 2C 68 [Dendrobium catenatum]PKU74952.1 putative protein phosphatase 2C 9 [Dendrobium catenatum]